MNALSLSLPPIASGASPALLPDGLGIPAFDASIDGQPDVAALPAAAAPATSVVQPPAESAVAMVAILDRSATMLAEALECASVTVTAPGNAEVPVTRTRIASSSPALLPGASSPPRRGARPSKFPAQPDVGDAKALRDETGLHDEQPMPVLSAAVAVALLPITVAATPRSLHAENVAQQGTQAVATSMSHPDGRRPMADQQAQAFGNAFPETSDAGAVAAGGALSLFRAEVSALSLPPTGMVSAERHLDLARGDAWLDDLARDIASTAMGGGHLKFALAPATLGRLDVEVRRCEAGVSVQMTAHHDATRDILTASQPRLADEIRAQGVRVNVTEVATDTRGFGGERPGTAPRQPISPLIESSADLHTTTAAPPKRMADGRYA